MGAGTDADPRTVTIPLDFLEAGVTQPDGTQAPDKTCYRIEKIKVTSSDTLTIEMAAGGGQAITFIP